jgi:hypothetical protein
MRRTKGRLSAAAAGIVTVALATELLPAFSGTGDVARWDWGFAYVTLHFVILPIACFAGLAVGGTLIVRDIASGRSAVMSPAIALTTVSVLYLLVLYLKPVPWTQG